MVGDPGTWVMGVMTRWVVRGVAGGHSVGRNGALCAATLPGDKEAEQSCLDNGGSDDEVWLPSGRGVGVWGVAGRGVVVARQPAARDGALTLAASSLI